MKLSIVQFTPVFGEKQENFRRLSAHSEQIDADVIVFPELCTTGYFFQSKEESRSYAETTEGETGDFFRSVAQEHDAMVVAGFVEKEGDNVYNSALIVSPNAPVQIGRAHV